MCGDPTPKFPGSAYPMPQGNELRIRGLGVMVERYSTEDREAVFAICQASPEAAQWARENYERAVEAGQLVLVGRIAEKVAGFVVARIAAGELEVLNMAIDATARRRGLGSALLQAIEAEGRAQRAGAMHLEVRESNQGARAFYERHGFRKSGMRAGYYREPLENAVLLEKKLTA
jgi:ribosomal-protein-alanine N-acetyltransferase